MFLIISNDIIIFLLNGHFVPGPFMTPSQPCQEIDDRHYYSMLSLSRVREYRKGSSQSVCQSVHLFVFLVDFLHIWYHDQVPSAVEACEIEFGSVPNLSN